MNLDPEDQLAVAVTGAIRTGDLEGLGRLLATHPGWPRPGWATTGPAG